MKLIVGLGNPGEEYKNSRHNTGWIVMDFVLGLPRAGEVKAGKNIDWKESGGKSKGLFYKDSISGKPAEFLKPLTFMNNSGNAVLCAKDYRKTSLKDIVVIYDDVDLPLGKIKISYDRSSGGHNGLESIIKKLKSREFVRVRVGISPTTPSGKLRKPKGEQAVLKFLMGDFKKPELDELKKISKKIKEALEIWATEGKDKAMSLYN